MNADLLTRLQKADHATWETYENHIAAIYYDAEGDECSLYAYDLMDCVHEAWLQACLQAAIWARKWFGWVGRIETSCFAEIHTKGAASRFENHEILYGQADTEAEALLMAYLTAINGG